MESIDKQQQNGAVPQKPDETHRPEDLQETGQQQQEDAQHWDTAADTHNGVEQEGQEYDVGDGEQVAGEEYDEGEQYGDAQDGEEYAEGEQYAEAQNGEEQHNGEGVEGEEYEDDREQDYRDGPEEDVDEHGNYTTAAPAAEEEQQQQRQQRGNVPRTAEAERPGKGRLARNRPGWMRNRDASARNEEMMAPQYGDDMYYNPYRNQQQQQQQEVTKKDEGGKNPLKLRLDLNLAVEIELKARIHGDLTLALLEM